MTRPTATPNRKLRRAAVRALNPNGDELTGLEELDFRDAANALGISIPPGLVRAFSGSQISVQLYRDDDTHGRVEFRLSVRRHDGQRLREHWRTLWRIKEFVCPGREAFEAYPPPSEVVDVAPMWHLWVLRSGDSLGVTLGRVWFPRGTILGGDS